MIALNKDDKAAAEKAKSAGVRRVVEMIEGLLPAEEKEEDDGGTAADGCETNVIVNQLACQEAGCPDVEVVITLLRGKATGRPKLMFKIYKAAADLSIEEVEKAMREALAEEQGHGKEHEHGHDNGHADGGGDCCEHGHAEHGHAEHGHAEHGHAEGADCCEHGHGEDHEHGHKGKEHEHGHESKQQKNEHEHT